MDRIRRGWQLIVGRRGFRRFAVYLLDTRSDQSIAYSVVYPDPKTQVFKVGDGRSWVA